MRIHRQYVLSKQRGRVTFSGLRRFHSTTQEGLSLPDGRRAGKPPLPTADSKRDRRHCRTMSMQLTAMALKHKIQCKVLVLGRDSSSSHAHHDTSSWVHFFPSEELVPVSIRHIFGKWQAWRVDSYRCTMVSKRLCLTAHREINHQATVCVRRSHQQRRRVGRTKDHTTMYCRAAVAGPINSTAAACTWNLSSCSRTSSAGRP